MKFLNFGKAKKLRHTAVICCDNFYADTTVTLDNGKYQVRLPLKPVIQGQLGTSRHQTITTTKRKVQSEMSFLVLLASFRL